MQQITGRLTADATVKNLESGKQVVSFSVADNQSYKPKGGDTVKMTTYFNCSYWISTAVAQVLRKGAVVQLSGRMSARAYTSNTGDVGASLNFNVGKIDVLSFARDGGNGQEAFAKSNTATTKAETGKGTDDDLPF